ncbi:MAG: MG2 domain-containing protein, partial [Kiritimatiellaeota bacterium]|nr:MG2 domain-containing protein [Kiritimatiellota bacterium]
MKLSPVLLQKIEEYLNAVAAQLGRQPAAARGELLSQLREHIADALQRRGATPTAADVETVLAEMDPPESFAEEEIGDQRSTVSGQPAAIHNPQAAINNSSKWLVVALVALTLNAWAVWKLTHPQPSKSTTTATIVAEKKLLALKLLAVQQVNLTPERELTLKLRFNSTPNRQKLKQFLFLYEGKVGDEKLDFDLVGQAGGSNVLVRAENVDGDKVLVELKPGLTGDSVTPLVDAQQMELEIATKLALQNIEAEAPAFGDAHIECSFTEQLDGNTAAAFVEVVPAIKFSADASWRALRLNGPFQPGAVYTLKFKAGLKSENNHALLKDLTRTVQIPNRGKAVTVATDGRYLSPRGTLAVPVSAMNLRRCIVTLAPVLPQNLVQLALRDCNRTRGYYSSPSDAADKLTGAEVVVTNAVNAPLNAETKFSVSLRDLAGPEPRGLFLLTVHGEDDAGQVDHRRYYGERNEDHRLLAVTDLGLSALLNAGGATVWVNSLRDAQPVAGAEVILYAENNSELARATTDASGLVKLAFARGAKAAVPFLVVARAGNDLSFLPLEKTGVTQAGETGGRAYLAEGYEAFVFSDRGIYRPGETAHFKALVRDRDLAAPPAFPALFRILKPNGRVFKDLPVQLDTAGAAEAEVALPEFLPTGRYTARLVLPGTFTPLGETVVMLEDFVPPQVRVAAGGPAERAHAGQPVLFDIHAEHLFG